MNCRNRFRIVVLPKLDLSVKLRCGFLQVVKHFIVVSKLIKTYIYSLLILFCCYVNYLLTLGRLCSTGILTKLLLSEPLFTRYM